MSATRQPEYAFELSGDNRQLNNTVPVDPPLPSGSISLAHDALRSPESFCSYLERFHDPHHHRL